MVAKIIYVASRPPFPKVGGREHMIAQSLEFLSEEYEVHVICFHGRDESVNENLIIELGVSSVTAITMASPLELAKNLVFRFTQSIQENLYYSSAIEKHLLQAVEGIKPDVIICDMLRTSQFFYDTDMPLVVDLDDVLSNRYMKMLDGGARFSSLGSFSERIPKLLAWVEVLARKYIIGYEYARIKKAEERALRIADAIILTSPLEADELNIKYSTSKATGVSQSVSTKATALPEGGNLLFVGNMTTAQNLASLENIVFDIMPKLNLISVKLMVVGRFDARAERIVVGRNDVVLLGFVENLDDVLKDCKVALMPVSFGTGVKTKILDAMAMGIPLVTNAVGVEGLSVSNEVHALISKDDPSAAENVNRLFCDSDLCKRLASNSRVYIEDKHSYEGLKERYNNIISGILN